METTIDRVRAAYDRDPEGEWRRLEVRAQMRLEYTITTHALGRHLPPPDPPCHVLDAGGGPGRYTIALARRGYRVTLFDLSPALLDLARRRIGEAGPEVERNVEAVIAGSITDLSTFSAARFDAVLCLGGPLSHLLDPAARRRALVELRRVARPGAQLFVSVMNRFGAYRSAVMWPSAYTQFFPHLPQTGIAAIGPGEAPAYFFLPEEFLASLEDAGLSVEHLYGSGGLGAHLNEDHLVALMDDPQRWSLWSKVLLATCDHPNVVGVSNHLLAVARKPG